MISTKGTGTNRKACYRCDYCGEVLRSGDMITLRDPKSGENDGNVNFERHFCNNSQAGKWVIEKYNLRLFDEREIGKQFN